MRLHRITTALALSCLVAGTAAAQNARNCGDRARIIDRLENHYGEVRTGAGLTPNNGMMEVYASDEKGTWTIIVTMPTGMTCLLAAGRDWQDGPPALTKSGSPV